ncbi:IclR family transcriptional regulator C-terminal domain-containing protein [Streptomyces sp. NPDC048612]|uniref:IclR family transcriptional regulator domain-containing protein n=1 Tax=Streptomyces sp. NPDC048612 TaxID=3365579 RepID=UPI00371D3A57
MEEGQVTGVGRFDEGSGSRQERVLPAELVQLMGMLVGPPDFWYRPDGDFGQLANTVQRDAAARTRANSLYRLGSRALDRHELQDAADWLGEAASCGHPGALFRLAVVAMRAGEDWKGEATFLIAEAARLGHGDAARLLKALAHRRPEPQSTEPTVEDVEFFDEARELLGIREEMLLPADASPAAQREAGRGSRIARSGARAEQPPLFLVPAPPLPKRFLPDQGGAAVAASDGGACSAPPPPRADVPALQVPDLDVGGHPAAISAAFRGGITGGEPWWSANALRPAVLNDMARSRPAPAPSPDRWQTAQRARDLIHLISSSGGIDTRTLAQRGKLSMNMTVRLLDWLREQRLVDSVGGAHRPGPIMQLTMGTDPGLLQRTLAELRDELDAAVYLSSYSDGEIRIHEAAHSCTAPPVKEWAPFSDTGHASAVGKSLLAQLDFDSRMDHLTRYPSVQLTDRTITNPRRLVKVLDGHGPHAAQFDLLEYSRTEVCVAYSLGLPGRASSIALSLPAHQHGRLITAARSLSMRATGILLAHLIADDQSCHLPLSDGVPRRALP